MILRARIRRWNWEGISFDSEHNWFNEAIYEITNTSNHEIDGQQRNQTFTFLPFSLQSSIVFNNP
jgi:hypothetical protein